MDRYIPLYENLHSKQYSVFVDLDGVLCDFDKALYDLTGNHRADSKLEDNWDMIKKAGVAFWEYMPWMKGGKDLWRYLTMFVAPVLLSAVPHPRYGHGEIPSRGKNMWVRRELGNYQVITCLRKQKKAFADRHNILIDDKRENIDEWKRAGGIGILHTNTSTTIHQLEHLGELQ